MPRLREIRKWKNVSLLKCATCGEWKMFSEFHNKKVKSYGIPKSCYCKTCSAKRDKERKDRATKYGNESSSIIGFYKITCEHCGKTVLKRKSNAVYCSTNCKSSHWKQKKKEKGERYW